MNRQLLFYTFFLVALVVSLVNAGCSTVGSVVGMSEEPKPKMGIDGKPLVRFSETPTVLNTSQREYQKMTRKRLEEESQLGANAGSMWVMEGQGAYLFSQNKTRKEGDLLNVSIEGAALKQVETKVSVIKKLLKQLEEEQQKKLQPQDGVVSQNLADGGKPAEGSVPRAPASVEKKDEKEEPLQMDVVPTRIVERLADGNYRVKGAQPFMIGKREYKMIVTGIIRPEDYNDQGVNSSKLLDPQYDVVSIRRNQ